MTPEEQQTVNAALGFLEKQVGNVSREGANAAFIAESLALRLKAMTEERDKLRVELDALKPKAEPAPSSNVVPITEPVA